MHGSARVGRGTVQRANERRRRAQEAFRFVFVGWLVGWLAGRSIQWPVGSFAALPLAGWRLKMKNEH